MNNKQFLKDLTLLSIPIILNELLNSSVNLIDVFMIGQLGDNAVAAVGLANQIFFLFIILTFGINSGASIFMGQYWGKGDVKSIHRIMGICLRFSLLGALVFACGAVFFPEYIMRFYSKDEAVIALGIDYLRIIGVSYLLTAVVVCFNMALKSTRCVVQPMVTTLVSIVTNVALNYTFIFIFKWGVQGAALATLIARALELAVLLSLSYGLKRPVAARIIDYVVVPKEYFKQYYKIAAPVILNEGLWALGNSLYNVAYKYSGTFAQAAVQISGNIQNLFMVLCFGVGTASGIMLSNTIGCGDSKRAISYAKKCLILSVIVSIFVSVLLVLFAPYILEAFKVDAVVKEYAYKMLIVIACGLWIKNITYVSIVGILRSGGDTVFCFLVDCLAVWLIGVPIAFLGSKYLGLPIYVTYALVYAEEFFKAIFCFFRIKSNKWAKSVVD